MEDYPRSLMELESRFSTEEACRDYLASLRWPNGFVCPRCANQGAWPKKTTLLECMACGHQASVTAGTIFERTRTPLPIWFRAIWWVVTQKNGTSALGLQRVLGIGSYETAWTWLHKIRRAMVRPDRDRLNGRVEVDETYLGGLEEGVRGRETLKKSTGSYCCTRRWGRNWTHPYATDSRRLGGEFAVFCEIGGRAGKPDSY